MCKLVCNFTGLMFYFLTNCERKNFKSCSAPGFI